MDTTNKSRRTCQYCSWKTIESKSIDKEKAKLYDFEQGNEGLHCIVCNNFACDTCLLMLCERIEANGPVDDKWTMYVRAYLSNSSFDKSSFVGSCCEFNFCYNDTINTSSSTVVDSSPQPSLKPSLKPSTKPSTKTPSPKPSFKPSLVTTLKPPSAKPSSKPSSKPLLKPPPKPSSNESNNRISSIQICHKRKNDRNLRRGARKRKKKNECDNKFDLDGHLFIPELHLLIDTPFDCIDIHGFAKIDVTMPGLWHCVLSEQCVIEAKKYNVQPIDIDEVITPTRGFIILEDPVDKEKTIEVKINNIKRLLRIDCFYFYIHSQIIFTSFTICFGNVVFSTIIPYIRLILKAILILKKVAILSVQLYCQSVCCSTNHLKVATTFR